MRVGLPLALFSLVIAWTIMLLFNGMHLDRLLLALVHARDRGDVAQAARLVTELGGVWVLIPATAAGALLLAFRRRFGAALILIVITLSGRLFVDLLKLQTARPRPEEYEHLVAVQSLAFPSAHAANSTMVYVTLALLLTDRYPGRAAALWGAVWLALLIGASRPVLGVHWPSDVIGGWAFGLFWALLLLRIYGHDISDGARRAFRHPSVEGEAR